MFPQVLVAALALILKCLPVAAQQRFLPTSLTAVRLTTTGVPSLSTAPAYIDELAWNGTALNLVQSIPLSNPAVYPQWPLSVM